MIRAKRRITQAYFLAAVEKYRPLIHRLSYRIGDNATQREDLISQAPSEVLRCMICYDGRGSFMTLLFSRLRGVFSHIRDADRRAKRACRMTDELMSQMVGPTPNQDTSMIVREGLECLNKDELDVVTQLFFDNRTIREVAVVNNTVPSVVFRTKERAMKKMRNKLAVK